jgi:hypothetical protein
MAEVVYKLAEELITILKWVEKVHSEHFALVEELAEERNLKGTKAIETVSSLQTAIDEKMEKLEPVVKFAEDKELT